MDKTLIVFLIGLLPLSAWSATAPNVSASELQSIESDIKNRKTISFAEIIKNWEERYSTRAVPPLLKIASSASYQDPERYVALMGAAKLGGTEAAPLLLPYLKDNSWMIRSGALRALKALNHPQTSEAVLPLLKDRALVVRLEAVEAVRKLQPKGSVNALAATLSSPANYHAGKATWVPQRALEALAELKAKEALPRLRPLLNKEKDADLLRKTVSALHAITGREYGRGKSLAEKVRLWKKYFPKV